MIVSVEKACHPKLGMIDYLIQLYQLIPMDTNTLEMVANFMSLSLTKRYCLQCLVKL